MKKNFLLALMALLCTPIWAGRYTDFYRQLPLSMPEAITPNIPDRTISILDCGAQGDGIAMNTAAFEKAISQLSQQGGGHIMVPAGIYLTGPITLKDNIDLHLDKNAIIVASPDKSVYIKRQPNNDSDKTTPLISASKRSNISITGEGVIDGNGEYWRPVKRVKNSDTEWNQYKSMGGTVSAKGDLWYPFNLKHLPNVAATAEEQEKMRAHLIRLTDCDRVLLQGVTIINSPRFHIVPQRCTNVIIDGVTVKCPWNAQNGDAIDIGNCRNVLIVNNTIDVGDDGICMKGGVGTVGLSYGPCENINIQNNTVFHAHGGFVIGSEFSGGMKNIVVRNNRFIGTDTGLRFKSAIKRGGATENIYIDHIYMTDIKDQAIVFQCDYWDNHVGAHPQKTEENKEENFVPNFKDIHISHVLCRNVKTGIEAHGRKDMIHDIDIKNSVIFYTDRAYNIDPDCDIQLDHVQFHTFNP